MEDIEITPLQMIGIRMMWYGVGGIAMAITVKMGSPIFYTLFGASFFTAQYLFET